MSIQLEIKNYRCFSDAHPARIFVGKGFTAFVGANNAGKSSLLLFLYEMRLLFHMLSHGGLLSTLRGLTDFSIPPTVVDVNEIFNKTNDRDITIKLTLPDVRTAGSPRAVEVLTITIPRSQRACKTRIRLVDGSEIAADGYSRLNLDGDRITGINEPIEIAELMRELSDLHGTMYIGSFRNVLNSTSNEDYYDVHVGQAFIRAWRQIKTGPKTRQNEAAFRLTKEIQRIFGFEGLEINASDEDRTLQLFINGQSFRLPSVGSGLAQFIIVLCNAAIRQSSYILIDEPELNLHPALQKEFLATLASHASQGVMFATHSVGLARSVAERIYSLSKLSEFERQVSPFGAHPRLSEFLGELSFSSHKEVGFNRLLLAEGPSDVMAIQQLLRKYNKDHEVLIVSLGGGSLINGTRTTALQLEELKRVCDNINVLIDSERDSDTDDLSIERQEFCKLCEDAGIKCHVLERRALENYFTDPAVRSVNGLKYRGLKPHEKLATVSPAWSKGENWRIAQNMSRGDMEGTDLGKFLTSL